MEEGKASIKHMEKEISILKREKDDYVLMSEDNFRKSEQRLKDKEDECERMWYRLETMKSYQSDRLTQQWVSFAAGDQPCIEGDHIPVNEDTFSDGFKDLQGTYVKSTFDPTKYSQVVHINDDVRVPSFTSTPLVRHSGGKVNLESTIEKVTLKVTE